MFPFSFLTGNKWFHIVSVQQMASDWMQVQPALTGCPEPTNAQLETSEQTCEHLEVVLNTYNAIYNIPNRRIIGVTTRHLCPSQKAYWWWSFIPNPVSTIFEDSIEAHTKKKEKHYIEWILISSHLLGILPPQEEKKTHKQEESKEEVPRTLQSPTMLTKGLWTKQK